MATLNNPVNPQNIVDRFADYVTATANSGIVWGTDSLPFVEFDVNTFGGDTTGRPISASGSNIGNVGTTITALNIYNALVTETNTYTNIRNLQAILFVDGDGGNTGTRPTQGVVFDTTAVAHMSTSYRQTVGSPSAGSVTSGNPITATSLEQFFTNLQASYNSARNTTTTVQVNVCHASCHSSCHGSRSRR